MTKIKCPECGVEIDEHSVGKCLDRWVHVSIGESIIPNHELAMAMAGWECVGSPFGGPNWRFREKLGLKHKEYYIDFSNGDPRIPKDGFLNQRYTLWLAENVLLPELGDKFEKIVDAQRLVVPEYSTDIAFVLNLLDNYPKAEISKWSDEYSKKVVWECVLHTNNFKFFTAIGESPMLAICRALVKAKTVKLSEESPDNEKPIL